MRGIEYSDDEAGTANHCANDEQAGEPAQHLVRDHAPGKEADPERVEYSARLEDRPPAAADDAHAAPPLAPRPASGFLVADSLGLVNTAPSRFDNLQRVEEVVDRRVGNLLPERSPDRVDRTV